jgi:enoyl-CoA hydratase
VIITSTPAAGVLLITIDGRRRRNALDLAEFRSLAAAWRTLEASDELRVGVVAGNGTDFCSGADLSRIGTDMADAARGGESGATIWRDVHAAVLRNATLAKPVVCAVEGVCFGAGMELAGATDIRIAGESARFALPEVRHGVIASGGSLARLARQIPYGPAMQILLTGMEASAARMAGLGFVNEVVADGQAQERALDIAVAIAGNAPEAVRATKRAVASGLATDLTGAYAIEERMAREILRGPEAAEGARAFREKRPPAWRLTLPSRRGLLPAARRAVARCAPGCRRGSPGGGPPGRRSGHGSARPPAGGHRRWRRRAGRHPR